MGMSDDVAAARLRLCRDRSYLSAAIWAMIPVEAPTLPAPMAVDKYWRLYFNMEHLKNWSVEQTSTVIYHEVLHLLRVHFKRAMALDPERTIWNMAVDCEINDDLMREGLDVLDGWNNYCHPRRFNLPEDELAEYYYRRLIEEVEVVPPPPGGGEPGGGGNRDEPGGGFGPEVAPNGESVKEDQGTGSCSDGADNKPWEQGAPTTDANGKEVNPGITEARGDLIREKTAEDIRQAAKTRGTVPRHMELLADQISNPKVNWRRELSAQIRNASAYVTGKFDYTYKKIGRRQSALPDVVMPGMHTPVPEVAVIIDTSGSMRGLLNNAMSEVGGILSHMGHTGAQIICVDAEVHNPGRAFKPSHIQLKGGGGTDMGLGYHYAAQMKPQPDIVICVTDGITPYPEANPGKYHGIVCLVDDGHRSNTPPSWLKTIRIDKEDLQ